MRDLPLDGQAFKVDLLSSNYGDNKGKARINGQLFMQPNYKATPRERFRPRWSEEVINHNLLTESLDFDRYEHFNDLLYNKFIENCQFGNLLFELRKVHIPKIVQDGVENAIFMVKLRCAGESKSIFVGSPDQIYGD